MPPAAVALRISVVVLTHNRRAELLRTLAMLSRLPDATSVCVVDNGSADGTALAVARDYPQVKLVRLAANLGAAGRNEGVRQAATDYVAFCDDDTWWAPGALTRAVELLDAHPTLAVVNARVLVGPEAREDPTSALMAASPVPALAGVPGTGLIGFMAGACVVRRQAFLQAGGYHPRFLIGGEEALLAMDLLDAGWQLAYVPTLTVHHHPSSLRESLRRRRLLLRNALWCAWLRRPWSSAWRETVRQVRQAGREPALWPALGQAIAGAAWVLRERRPLAPAVERQLRRVEGS